MSDEIKLPPAEELLEMVETLTQHADSLIKLLEVERQKNAELNTENAGWLKIFQRLQSEIAGLKAEISRLESHIRAYQGES